MKTLENFIAENNFKEDKKRSSIYGVIQGYPVIVTYEGVHSQYLITINARGEDTLIEKHRLALSDMAKDEAQVNYVNYNEGIVSINMSFNKKENETTLNAILKKVTAYLAQEGFTKTCRYCDHQELLDFYSVQGHVEVICDDCYEKITHATISRAQKPENMPAGLAGAILGALIGVALWVVVYQLGFIVAIVAWLMVVCAIKGYEKFAGILSKKGLWAAIIISVLMLFVAEYLSIGLSIYIEFKDYYSISIIEAMQTIPAFLQIPEIMGVFVKDIAIGLIFMAFASYRYVMNIYKAVASAYDIQRLG